MAAIMTTESRSTTTYPTSVEINAEGIWREQFAQVDGYREVVLRKPLPMQLVSKYANLAIRAAEIKQLEDGTWFADIPGFVGVWADGPSVAEALETLEEVVFDWVLVKVADSDDDIPIVCEINFSAL